jgi:hypothetical protein
VLCQYPRNFLSYKMIHTFVLSLSCNRLQLLCRLLVESFKIRFCNYTNDYRPWRTLLGLIISQLPVRSFISCLCYPGGARKNLLSSRPCKFLSHLISRTIFHRRIYWRTDDENLTSETSVSEFGCA